MRVELLLTETYRPQPLKLVTTIIVNKNVDESGSAASLAERLCLPCNLCKKRAARLGLAASY